MKVNFNKRSIISGKINQMEIDVTPEEMEKITQWMAGDPKLKIQNVLPNHTPEEREFLMTGMSIEEQNDLFNKEMEDLI